MAAQSNKPEQTIFQDGKKLQLMSPKKIKNKLNFGSDDSCQTSSVSDDLNKRSMSTTAPQDTNVHILPPKDIWDKPIDRVVM